MKNRRGGGGQNALPPARDRVDNIFFDPVSYGLSGGGIHFSVQRISFFQHFFFLGQTFRTKENNSV